MAAELHTDSWGGGKAKKPGQLKNRAEFPPALQAFFKRPFKVVEKGKLSKSLPFIYKTKKPQRQVIPVLQL